MGFGRQAQTHTYCLPLGPGTLTMIQCATLGLWHTHMSNVHPCCVVSLCGGNNKCYSCGRPSNLPRTAHNMSLTEPYVSQYRNEFTKVPYAWTKEGPWMSRSFLMKLRVSELFAEPSDCWLSEAFRKATKANPVAAPVIKQINRVALLSKQTFLRQ